MGAGWSSGELTTCCLGAWWDSLTLHAAEAPLLTLGHLLRSRCCCWQPSELVQAEMTSLGQSVGLKKWPNRSIFIVPVLDSQMFLTDVLSIAGLGSEVTWHQALKEKLQTGS